MKIFLIGLSTSGKSTLGKELATALAVPFVDLDSEIEREAGMDIKSIFRQKGETHFRELEAKTLGEWCQSQHEFVMATGGGAPCFFNAMKIINAAGKSIFLDVPTMEIIRRINKTERSERPLLGNVHGGELKEQIESMHRNRLPFYNQATVKLSGPKLSVEDLLKSINE